MRQRQPGGAHGLLHRGGIVERAGVEHVVLELVVHGAGAQLQLVVVLVFGGRRRIELQQLVELVLGRRRWLELQLFEPVQLVQLVEPVQLRRLQLVVVAPRLAVRAAGAILGACRS